MWRAERNGWLLEVAMQDDGVRAWVSNPARSVVGYGFNGGERRGWDEIADAATTAIALAVGSPFTGAELDGVKCLRCGKSCEESHARYTRADVELSHEPGGGRLSPSVVGSWKGHEPLPFLA